MSSHWLRWKKLKPYHGAGILFWLKEEKNNLQVLLGERMYNPQRGK